MLVRWGGRFSEGTPAVDNDSPLSPSSVRPPVASRCLPPSAASRVSLSPTLRHSQLFVVSIVVCDVLLCCFTNISCVCLSVLGAAAASPRSAVSTIFTVG